MLSPNFIYMNPYHCSIYHWHGDRVNLFAFLLCETFLLRTTCLSFSHAWCSTAVILYFKLNTGQKTFLLYLLSKLTNDEFFVNALLNFSFFFRKHLISRCIVDENIFKGHFWLMYLYKSTSFKGINLSKISKQKKYLTLFLLLTHFIIVILFQIIFSFFLQCY